MTASMLMLIGGMALVTFLCRYPLIALAGRITLPPVAERILDYVGPAVLAAVIALEVAAPVPTGALPAYIPPRLIAALVAALVAWRTRHVWLTVIAGLTVLSALQIFFS